MKIKHALHTLFLLAALAALAGPARAALIANGGFDSDALGWNWTHISAGGWQSTGGNPGGMFILNDAGSSTTDPTIEQLVTGLITGDPYRLTGDYRNFHGCYWGSCGPETFAVDVGGIEHLFGFPGAGEWGSFLVDFNAPGTEVLIRFRAEIDGDDTDYAIDNIALVHLAAEGSAPVPLPGVLLLLGAGLLALGATRRR